MYLPGYLTTLRRHFGSLDTTLVISETPLGWQHSQREGILIPDLLVAFDVDPSAVIARRGYAIEEQGKTPDFVLEVASESTGQQDGEPGNAAATRPMVCKNTGASTPPAASTTGNPWPGTP